MRSFPTLLCLPLFCALILQEFHLSEQLERQHVGRVMKTQVEALYDMRNRLSKNSGAVPSSSHSQSDSSRSEKEGRGYAFHYNPSDISHPLYSTSYASQGFHSRMGKVSEVTSPKKKYVDKNWDKYSKYAYKTEGKDEMVNSFNIHQNKSSEPEPSVSSTTISTSTTSIPTSSASSTTVYTTSASATNPIKSASSILDISRLATLGLGLNDAMTSVLTQKLMGMIDQEVPQGILNPMKHIVSSGNRMVEFWDKRANARDGKPPGIVEMLGYGLEQLKKFRDGQPMKPSDPVANLTSASKTLIQGMVTVKKLTNRVLGYDTDEAAVESRGGYGHDSYGGGGYGHQVSYGGGLSGLDPFALLAALAFGAFLLQLLLTLLNTSARSLDVVDINTPLMLSDYHVPNFMTDMDKIFGTPTTRTKRSADLDENPIFNSIIDKLDGLYSTYKVVSGKPSCARLYLCRLAVQDAEADVSSVSSRLYMYGLEHLSADRESHDFIKTIQRRISGGEVVNCNNWNEAGECSPPGSSN